jgi:hypothetical protein
MQPIVCKMNNAIHESWHDTKTHINLCELCHNTMQNLTIAFFNQHVVHLDLNPKIHKFILKQTHDQVKTIKWAS